VQTNGVWEGVCCVGGTPVVSDQDCEWIDADRILADETAGLELSCPEGDPISCTCIAEGEPLHGVNGWDLDASLDAADGGPVYPDEGMATCIVVGAGGALETDWTGACPSFRLDGG
jgi:hypothetical protein